jgi:hypothetical protein
MSHKSTCCEGGLGGGHDQRCEMLNLGEVGDPTPFSPPSPTVEDSVKSIMFRDRFKANPDDFLVV